MGQWNWTVLSIVRAACAPVASLLTAAVLHQSANGEAVHGRWVAGSDAHANAERHAYLGAAALRYIYRLRTRQETDRAMPSQIKKRLGSEE